MRNPVKFYIVNNEDQRRQIKINLILEDRLGLILNLDPDAHKQLTDSKIPIIKYDYVDSTQLLTKLKNLGIPVGGLDFHKNYSLLFENMQSLVYNQGLTFWINFENTSRLEVTFDENNTVTLDNIILRYFRYLIRQKKANKHIINDLYRNIKRNVDDKKQESEENREDFIDDESTEEEIVKKKKTTFLEKVSKLLKLGKKKNKVNRDDQMKQEQIEQKPEKIIKIDEEKKPKKSKKKPKQSTLYGDLTIEPNFSFNPLDSSSGS
jgi:carbamoylphosphate synthase small subunit